MESWELDDGRICCGMQHRDTKGMHGIVRIIGVQDSTIVEGVYIDGVAHGLWREFKTIELPEAGGSKLLSQPTVLYRFYRHGEVDSEILFDRAMN